MHGVPYFTTVQASRMAVGALEALAKSELTYRPLQEYLGLPERPLKETRS